MKNKHLSIRIEEVDYHYFNRLYPNCLTRFVRNAIKYSIKHKNLFEKIFFMIEED